MGVLLGGKHFLRPWRMLSLKLPKLLFPNRQVLCDAGKCSYGLWNYGLLGLCHTDQYLSSFARNWDMYQRWRSLVRRRRVLRFHTPIQLSRHESLLPDSDGGSRSLRGNGLLNLQDDFGLHEDMFRWANIGHALVYLQQQLYEHLS